MKPLISSTGTLPRGEHAKPGRRNPFVRRAVELARWITPGVVLALMPKCPVCLAGYIAVGTGLGLSLSMATHLRWFLIGLCILSLVWLVVRRLRNWPGLAGRSYKR